MVIAIHFKLLKDILRLDYQNKNKEQQALQITKNKFINRRGFSWENTVLCQLAYSEMFGENVTTNQIFGAYATNQNFHRTIIGYHCFATRRRVISAYRSWISRSMSWRHLLRIWTSAESASLACLSRAWRFVSWISTTTLVTSWATVDMASLSSSVLLSSLEINSKGYLL